MKSIAVLCNYKLIPNRVGGMDYFFYAFDQACRHENYDITWYFPNQAQYGFYPQMNIIAANENSIEKCFLEDIQVTAKKFDYIIVHFLELCTSFYKKAKQLTGAKIIAVDHNPRPSNGYVFRIKVKKIVFSAVYGRYIDHFIAVSSQTINDLNNDFPFIRKSKKTIILNGLPFDLIKSRIPKHKAKCNFIVSSHLRPEKGIENIVQAVSMLSSSVKSKMQIDVYGDGPDKQKIESLILEKGLNHTIFIKGSSNSIHSLYANYDYLIHPSFAETFCYSVVESLLANLPVITTQEAGNILGLVTNEVNGFTYPTGEINVLADILKKVVIDQIYLVIETRKTLEKEFSTKAMVQRYLAIL